MIVKKTVKFLKKFAIFFILLLVVTIFEGKTFYSFFNVMNILLSVSIYGIMICGSIFPLLVGGMDLSIGSTAAFSAILGVQVMAAGGFSVVSVLLGVLVALAVGGVIGLTNGAISYFFDVPALLTTISTQYIFYALAQLITKNRTLSGVGSELFDFIGSGTIFGIPFPIFIMLALGVVIFFLLNKTVFGREVYAVGGNKKASKMMGLNPAKIIILSYVLSGVSAAVGGLVLTSMNTMVRANTGYGYELYVFVGLMIGGVNFAGGEGTIQGALYGTVLVGLMNNVLMMIGVESTYHGMVQGLVIVVCVALSMQRRMKESGLGGKTLLRRLARNKTVITNGTDR